MQRERKYWNDLFDVGKQFNTFGSFGGFQSMGPSLFGRRDPFDDLFFTRPFESMIEPSIFDPSPASNSVLQTNKDKGVVIQELDSDEEEAKGAERSTNEHSGSSKEPSIEHPEDDERNIMKYKNDRSRVEGTKSQAHTFSFHTSRVTYGGVDGAYYTSTRTRRTGNDGTVLEESKEADKTTGQATHRVSRGIHDKGHSVTRKLNTDGKVDTMQTLHNLNEAELARFEEAWEGNSKGHWPDWCSGYGMHGTSGDEQGEPMRGGWILPSVEQAGSVGGIADSSSGGRTNKTKKVVRINIE